MTASAASLAEHTLGLLMLVPGGMMPTNVVGDRKAGAPKLQTGSAASLTDTMTRLGVRGSNQPRVWTHPILYYYIDLAFHAFG